MKSNLSPFDRIARIIVGLFFLLAAWMFFVHPLARLFFIGFAIFSFFEAKKGICPALNRCEQLTQTGSTSPEPHYLMGLLSIQTIIAYVWFSGGIGKFLHGNFPSGMKGTLAAFASKNPFEWYQSFLLGFATTHATLFGWLVELGEIGVGLGLLIGMGLFLWKKKETCKRCALRLIAVSLIVGMFLSANFYFAAGWMSVSTKELNIVLFLVQAVLLYVWLSLLTTKEFTKK